VDILKTAVSALGSAAARIGQNVPASGLIISDLPKVETPMIPRESVSVEDQWKYPAGVGQMIHANRFNIKKPGFAPGLSYLLLDSIYLFPAMFISSERT
jgi:hypothetical protein